MSPTFSPSRTPTSVPSRSPTTIPTSKPTPSPTTNPSAFPTLSLVPTNILDIAIIVSITQKINDIDAATFKENERSNNFKFEDAIISSLGYSSHLNINVVTVTDYNSSLRSGPVITRNLVGSSMVMVTYNMTLLVNRNGYQTADEAYNDLINDINYITKGGSSSILTFNLQLQGNPFLNTSVPDENPMVSPYRVVAYHSPSPTNLPTSSPSCGDTTLGDPCRECEPGFYLSYTDDGVKECRECSVGYYTDTYGNVECKKCSWPHTTLDTGNTECTAFQISLGSVFLIGLVCVVCTIFVICILTAKNNRIVALVIMCVPMVDVLTDLMYLVETKFYNMPTFIACGFFLVGGPLIIFISLLIELKSSPNLPGMSFFKKFLWLGVSQSGYPSYNGSDVVVTFQVHDSIVKLIYFAASWLLCVIMQGLCLVPAACVLLIQAPFIFIWLIIGTFLFQIKVLSIGTVWNFWFSLWSGDDVRFYSYVEVDVKLFNKSLLAEFVSESLPQIIVQAYNNTKTNKWSYYGYASGALSAFMTIDGIWRILYYKIYSGKSFADIPVGMGRIVIRNTITEDITIKIKMMCMKID
jgi:hypothetical protein